MEGMNGHYAARGGQVDWDPRPPTREERQQARREAKRAREEAMAWRRMMAGPALLVLGLSAGGTKEEIRQAYHHRLALQHHPDRGGDPAAFRKVAEAYRAAMWD